MSRADAIVDEAIARAKTGKSGYSDTVGGALLKGLVNSSRTEEQKLEAKIREIVGMTGVEALVVGRRALNAYIAEEAAPVHKSFERLKENFEVLDGTRNRTSPGKAAVRFDNIKALSAIPSQPPTARKTINPNPTQEEFNALFDDVRKLYNALFEISIQIRSNGSAK